MHNLGKNNTEIEAKKDAYRIDKGFSNKSKHHLFQIELESGGNKHSLKTK